MKINSQYTSYLGQHTIKELEPDTDPGAEYTMFGLILY